MKSESSILFPPFRLDVVNERLERGSQTIALRPKTFAVLRYLLEQPGQLVTKEELLEAVWPDTHVSEAGLKDYIQEIRKALGDEARTPRFIETVHRRGYRFIGAVTVQTAELAENGKRQITPLSENDLQEQTDGAGLPEPSVEPIKLTTAVSSAETESQKSQVESPNTREAGVAHRHWARAAVIGLVLIGGIATLLFSPLPLLRIPQSAFRNQEVLPLPDKPSVVVMPFTNLSGDPEQEYFSDGLTDDLITDLSKISGLFVIARYSAFTYKGKAVKVQEIGKELGVRYVLEGSVRKTDDRVRITTQLVDATTGYDLWSERYDRRLTDLFALQDEITQKIVLALKVKLTKEGQERFRRVPTDSLEAYDYLLRGGEYFNRFTKEANAQAQQMYEKAGNVSDLLIGVGEAVIMD